MPANVTADLYRVRVWGSHADLIQGPKPYKPRNLRSLEPQKPSTSSLPPLGSRPQEDMMDQLRMMEEDFRAVVG